MRQTAALVLRLVMAAASLAGVVTQFVIAVQIDFGVVNFFSYFTTLSNLFASIVFLVGAAQIIRKKPAGPRWDAVRGSSVVYMAFVGIVFNTLLAGADVGPLLPWTNVVHHMLMPLAVVIDWLLLPPRTRLSLRTAFVWILVPVVYTVYSVVRGAITGFYCYPFFNPAAVGGYGGVALYCVVLLIGFIVLALVIRAVGNAMSRRSVPVR
ncbi:Pr6Pr family membrane protein [Microbacterium sp. P03]|uniref:Pr6Pr family membrane protein n=1 Tax=Microbacterium sp. P03 TaxID=3366946 RepID=UPI003745907A